MDLQALFKITYGLYLLTAREGEKDNGCIINTALQLTDTPVRASVTVTKKNYTHDMIMKTGEFNVSAITTRADFELFRRFGMQSGRDADKFAGFEKVSRSENGLLYLTEANMYFSAKVVQQVDLETHTMFIAEITDAKTLSEDPPCTYSYYQSDIKPKPQPTSKKQWVCSVCGYVYEGDEVPEDYICPLCKHGKEAFVLEGTDTAKSEAPVASNSDSAAKKWVCTVCGYVHEGDAPPKECPICGFGAEKFKEAKC